MDRNCWLVWCFLKCIIRFEIKLKTYISYLFTWLFTCEHVTEKWHFKRYCPCYCWVLSCLLTSSKNFPNNRWMPHIRDKHFHRLEIYVCLQEMPTDSKIQSQNNAGVTLGWSLYNRAYHEVNFENINVFTEPYRYFEVVKVSCFVRTVIFTANDTFPWR